MIRITETDVYGFDAAIRGMRNPMNSWDKSDTKISYDYMPNDYAFIGKNDLDLMKKLIKAGSDHRKFMRMITVSADILAPLYWWKEYDTYKVGTVANSCSTMHKIADKEFTLEDFSHEHLEQFSDRTGKIISTKLLETIIIYLNDNRKNYLKTKDKQYWWQMIQLLPSSYNQLRTVQLNYEVLYSIYFARIDHKLDEWNDFCKWIKTLPYMVDFLEA